MSLEQRVYDAEKAKNILENDVFIAIFDDLEKDLVEKWKSCESAADREKIHVQTQLFAMIRRKIMLILESGKIAKSELDHRQSLREKLQKKPEEWLRSVQY
jgi:hypothetical protein